MARIPEAFVQEVLSRTDVVDVVGRYVTLKKAGANLLGLCPFHGEKSPSFTVSPTKQFYHCFGCGAHGTALGFLMQHGGMAFPDAVRSLARDLGLDVPEEQGSSRDRAAIAEQRQLKDARHQLLERANQWYRTNLRQSRAAVQYLQSRGLTGEIAGRFQLGYAPSQAQGLRAVFEDYDDPGLVEVGLLSESDNGERRDRFRDRVTFPIRNARGELIGFGGRVLSNDAFGPKYLNSPETPLFHKGRELYGLWEARQAIRQAGQVVVVEGYMDVVALAQHGVAYAVATLGTATTPDHIKRLMRETSRIVFAFDGDSAGRKAAWKALVASLPLLRDDLTLRFLFLPAEHDPDSYVREHGASGFAQALEQATTLSGFLLEHLQHDLDLQSPEGRAALVHVARPCLQAMPAIGLRVQLVRALADLARLTPDELTPSLELSDEPSGPLVAIAQSDSPRGLGMRRDPASASVAPEGVSGIAVRRNAFDSRGAAPTLSAKTAGRRVVPLAERVLRLLLRHPDLAPQVPLAAQMMMARRAELATVARVVERLRLLPVRHAGGVLEALRGTEDFERVQLLAAASLNDVDHENPVVELQQSLLRMELQDLQESLAALAEHAANDPLARAEYQSGIKRLQELKGVVSAQGDA